MENPSEILDPTQALEKIREKEKEAKTLNDAFRIIRSEETKMMIRRYVRGDPHDEIDHFMGWDLETRWDKTPANRIVASYIYSRKMGRSPDFMDYLERYIKHYAYFREKGKGGNGNYSCK